ncbi:hypothetical protein CcI49_23525 [Frankia sp. CcI49]|uniref:hypothetical protein n=1 Tax=unclassified Frankia TaxID=2632575 RepID=UPI0009CB2A1F|nr:MULTISPECIES: hypothetical protein [unclassified Frankia]ONH57920.1 hypothetical protein CcI49_23525 [Frankia sp. CcI49]
MPFGIVALFFLRRATGDRPVHGKHGKISSGALALVFTGVALNSLVGAMDEKHGAAGVALTLLGLACLMTAIAVWVWQGWREGAPGSARRARLRTSASHSNSHSSKI